MGQYYKPVNIKTMEWVYSHSHGSGLKLMEHSWIGNGFVGVVMTLLSPKNKWYKSPIVWCGDYYDEKGEKCYYSLVKDSKELKDVKSMSEKKQTAAILVNHTKKMYAVYKDIIANDSGYKANPLPLLTALGNGRGGGDYHEGPGFDKIGIWAKDILSIEFSRPKGYEKLTIDFYEKF